MSPSSLFKVRLRLRLRLRLRFRVLGLGVLVGCPDIMFRVRFRSGLSPRLG